MSTPAGKGNNHRFILASPNGMGDQSKLQEGKDYIKVDAVSWYVNRQGNFFVNRMVAGTLEFRINGQDFSTVLGSYDLRQGQRTAPVFDQPIVPWVAYQGGDLMLRAYIRGTQQNTAAGDLLSKMAVASLTVVAGAIEAETGGLATMALVAAGSTLTKGASSMLSSNTPKTIQIFESFQVNVDLSSQFKGKERYVVVHRGNDDIRESDLSIVLGKSGAEVQCNSSFFDDGAWILFRIQKSDVYTGNPRPWFDEAESVKNSIEELISYWQTKSLDVDSVATALVPTGKEPANVGDKYMSICRRIRADLVLTRIDRTAKVGGVRTFYEAAQAAVEAKDPDKFHELRNQTQANLKKGIAPPERIAAVFREEALSLQFMKRARSPILRGQHERNLWKSLSAK
jgi:hypothetical protein